jgi:hypothetical protein
MIANGVGHEPQPTADQSAGRCEENSADGYGPPHPLTGVFELVRELAEYANFYVETRKDSFRATLRGLVLKAVLGLIAAVGGIALIITAAVYLMSGIAHGIGYLLGEHNWLGELIVSVAFFIVLAVAAVVGMKVVNKRTRERTVKKYERRQKEQRERFGHSMSERAEQIRQSHRSRVPRA